MGRLVTEVMAKELGQPIVMDFKPGAGGQVAAQHLARAAPDGYTLMFATSGPFFYLPYLTAKLPYDAKRDFTYINQVTNGGLILLVNKDVPATNMNELVDWIRKQCKGKVAYASYGIGSVSHLLSAYLSASRGLDMVHTAYRGEGQMITDMIGGQVPVGIGSIWSGTPHIKDGRLRGLAVFTPQRHEMLAQVPTMLESGFTDDEFQVVSGMFMVGPAGLPPEVVARVESAVRKAMSIPAVRERFSSIGSSLIGGTADEARQVFDSAQPRVARLVKISGASLD